MARRSSKPSVIETTAVEPDVDERVIVSISDPAFRDAELEELREIESKFRDPTKLLEKVGDELYLFDPVKLESAIRLAENKRQDVSPTMRYLARIQDKIVFDPRVNAVPIGTGSELTKLAMEDRLWNNGPGNTVVGLGSVNLTEAQRKACAMTLSHPIASNIIRNLTTLTMGEGVTINWTGTDKRRSGDGLKTKWAKWETENRFQEFIRDVTRMCFMLGEVFVVSVPPTDGAPQRFEKIEPDRIKRIFYDVTTGAVRGYEMSPAHAGGKTVFLRADDVRHIKFETIGNVPRGIPRLLPVFVSLRQHTLFVENRHWINMIRARIPLVRTIKGGTVAIQREKARTGTLPPPGTVQYDVEGSDWKMPGQNIGASDVVDDRKLIESCIAAGVSMPIMLVTGDLSANYSSGVLAESPLVRDIEDKRDILREPIEWMVSKVMSKSEGFAVQYPPVVRRNFADVAAAAVALVNAEVWSRRTAAEATGKSWDDIDGERARIVAEEDDGFVAQGSVDPFNKPEDGGVGRPTTGTAMGGSSLSKAKGGDGEG